MIKIAISDKSKKNSYLEGFTKCFDISGTNKHEYQLYDVFNSNNSFSRDRESLLSDWKKVGSDLRNSITKFSEQVNG